MKKTFFFLVAFVATVVGANAQGQTATLQQGDKMTPFYGPDAFVQAYNAAQNGAVITLSAGNFNTVDSITKQVTIIGNGCETNGGTNRTRINSKSITNYGSSRYACLIINANNVKIEGVQFSYSVYLRNVSNTLFRNCNFDYYLYGTHTHTNTVIDQCYVSSLYALNRAENMCIKNSFLDFLYGGESSTGIGALNTTSNPAYFSNCVIYHYFDYVQLEGNSYIRKYDDPYGTYKNCILGYRSYNYNFSGSSYTSNPNYWNQYYISPGPVSGNEYYNNVFFLYPYKAGSWSSENVYPAMKNKEMNFNWAETQTQKGNTSSTWSGLFNDEEGLGWWEKLRSDIPFKGDDGTVVGPYGGTGFSINPSIPRIVESTIDSNTNADGKLNVKIKVELNQ